MDRKTMLDAIAKCDLVVVEEVRKLDKLMRSEGTCGVGVDVFERLYRAVVKRDEVLNRELPEAPVEVAVPAPAPKPTAEWDDERMRCRTCGSFAHRCECEEGKEDYYQVD